MPEKSHGQRSLAGYSPQGHKELERTEQLSMHAPKGREREEKKKEREREKHLRSSQSRDIGSLNRGTLS